MIDFEFLARISIEPLDRKKHDRAAFSCGETRIDNYIAKSAAKHQDENVTRVRVACLDEKPAILGFYALNSHAIDVSSLPPEARKHLPHYPTAPAIYLSMIAVHSDHQGKGIGQFLLADALKRIQKVSEEIGSRFIVLDALNDNAARLYARMGFIQLSATPGRMILDIATIGKAKYKAGKTVP
jgi:ribosomal protein S18 acetylase RimI-like enzyme